jgi:hypothetical protein
VDRAYTFIGADVSWRVMTTTLVLALLPLLAAGREADAATPDFSGTWDRVEAEPELPSVDSTGDAAFRQGSMGSGWGSPFTIRQDASAFVVEYVHFSAYDLQPPIRLTYALDGSESRNAVMIGHAASPQRSRITWRDRTLVITTELPGPEASRPIRVRQALTLESPDTLRVETTREALDGAPPSVTRATYAKRQKPGSVPGPRG